MYTWLSKHSYIHVSGGFCVRYFDGDILQKGERYLPKKHKGVGIHISSIQAIAEKNGGSCSFSFADNVFSVYVLLIS